MLDIFGNGKMKKRWEIDIAGEASPIKLRIG
jgi:hypothetical protein